MSAIRVEPVTSRRDRKRFINFPYDFYRDDYPQWVPPLRRDVKKTLNTRKNAFFEHGDIQLFLATDASGGTVGRIAAIVNGMHLQKYEDGTGFFGFFESVEEPAVAEALIGAASDWLREQGLSAMRGPANPSLNDTAGLLVDGFQFSPSILMPYNPPYYEELLRQNGFERVMTMWAFYAHKKYAKMDRLRRGVEIVQHRNPGLELRTLDMNRFEQEAETIREIYNEAWSNNWGHVPMTDAEFKQLASDLRQIVDPNVVFILELDGEPVAFSITLPNLNQVLQYVDDGRLFPLGLPKLLMHSQMGTVYEARMPLMGVRSDYQGRGFDSWLILETMEVGPKHGYDACEVSWILDTNKRLLNAIDNIGATKDKEYAMFERSLTDDENS